MKDAILLELARRWVIEAAPPEIQNGAEEAKIQNAVDQGRREAKRECADGIKALVSLLGEVRE